MTTPDPDFLCHFALEDVTKSHEFGVYFLHMSPREESRSDRFWDAKLRAKEILRVTQKMPKALLLELLCVRFKAEML